MPIPVTITGAASRTANFLVALRLYGADDEFLDQTCKPDDVGTAT
jgi:hypothetical protein